MVDARDHGAQAEWWARVLGGDVEYNRPTEQDEWHIMADPEGNEFCVFAPEPR